MSLVHRAFKNIVNWLDQNDMWDATDQKVIIERFLEFSGYKADPKLKGDRLAHDQSKWISSRFNEFTRYVFRNSKIINN